MGTRPDPVCRRSYQEDSGLEAEVFALLEQVFPGIGTTARRAAALGAPWASVSRPYVLAESGRIVAHLGLIELELVLAGVERTVGTIHAVATHPERRRRGLFRELMEAALADCEGRIETLILTTESPEYYTPFGFRVVPEHEFRIGWKQRAAASAMRALDPSRPEDLDTLHRLLATRTPVSSVCGVVRERAVFCFNEGRGPLWYAADLDALCVFAWAGDRLDLFDVVAPRMPTLEEIVARLPEGAGPREIVVHFSPDRLSVGVGGGRTPEASIVAVPRLFDHQGPSYLLARGDLLPEDAAFSLPRSART